MKTKIGINRLAGSVRLAPEQTPAIPISHPGSGPYAAWHRTCGHAVAIHADRSSVESMIQGLRGSGRFVLRVRIATRDDIDGCTRGITCNICRGLA
jgi:hypothetical protein